MTTETLPTAPATSRPAGMRMAVEADDAPATTGPSERGCWSASSSSTIRSEA